MWVLIYLAIALAGLVMVGCFAVWLWHKAMALLREAGVLLERADELASILGRIGEPTPVDGSQSRHSIVDDDDSVDHVQLARSRRQAT